MSMLLCIVSAQQLCFEPPLYACMMCGIADPHDLRLCAVSLLFCITAHPPSHQVTGRKERERLEERRQFPLEDQLRKSLVGQELAIKTVAAGGVCTLSCEE